MTLKADFLLNRSGGVRLLLFLGVATSSLLHFCPDGLTQDRKNPLDTDTV